MSFKSFIGGIEMITVYTAIYGGFDGLKEQPKQNIDCRFVCFTDNPELENPGGWEIIVDNTYKHLHPRIQSRYYKFHPFEFFEGDIVWIDASCRLLQSNSIEYFKKQIKGDIATFRHATRDSSYEEARYCIDNNIPKSIGKPLIEQVEYYKNRGYRFDNGLSANGLLVFNYSHKLEEALDELWKDIVIWTYQDQLSFDYYIWKYNLKRDWFEKNQLECEHTNFFSNHLIEG